MKICDEYKKWVEERIEEPIRKRKVGVREECKKKKCRKLCLCCNKWFCWLEWFFYWIVEWIVRIVGKWIPYIVCRIVSSLITLFLLALWIAKMIICAINVSGDSGPVNDLSNLNLRPLLTLEVEVVIIDKDANTNNPITEQEIKARLKDADRILQERSRIQVKQAGDIRRKESESLYRLDQSTAASKLGEWLKGIGLLMGRESPLRLTVYAIGSIDGAEALHQPFYGSVFIVKGNPETSLAHELGHALLAVDRMNHSSTRANLMYVPWDERERDSSWPRGTPNLTVDQWCTMRQSRWLNWLENLLRCEKCPN